VNKTLALLISAGLLLVVIGLILSIGAQINQDIKDNSKDSTTVTHTNESVTSSQSGNDLTCQGNGDSPANVEISQAYNGSLGATAGQDLDSNNYTYTPQTGWINFTTTSDTGDGSGYEETGLNFTVTYTCSNYGAVWSIGLNSTTALNEMTQWNSTIAIVIAAVVIITLLLSGFGAWLYFKM